MLGNFLFWVSFSLSPWRAQEVRFFLEWGWGLGLVVGPSWHTWAESKGQSPRASVY